MPILGPSPERNKPSEIQDRVDPWLCRKEMCRNNAADVRRRRGGNSVLL